MNLTQIINDLPCEYRAPVAQAVSFSDGSRDSIRSEIQSLVWEHPDLPVDDILERLR